MHDFLLIKVLGFLTLILLGAYLIFLLIKKHLGRFGALENKISVIEHKKIDHKTSVVLVEIEHKKFIVAFGLNAIAIHPLE